MNTVAALYVLPDGPYVGIPGVDVWDESRDARLYPGPYPVVAHPPCARWGRWWYGGAKYSPSRTPYKLGDDGGCFAAALGAVRRWGGVLEHPEASHAWDVFDLKRPRRWGGWVPTDREGGWTCCVEQGHYGHLARKATWLYARGTILPDLHWGPSVARAYISAGLYRKRDVVLRGVQELSHRQRLLTPLPFRDLLLGMARSVYECSQ